MIFLIREWVVQQQPDLALAGDAGGIGNLADLGQAPEEPAAGAVEEDQEEDQEEDGLPNDQILDAAFGRVHPPYPESEADPLGEEHLVVQQQVAPPARPIAPLRRRRAFAPAEENHPPDRGVGTGSAFGGQGMVLGRGLTMAPPAFQLDSSNPRRPQANREVMAQAAELRIGPDYLEKFAVSSTITPQTRASSTSNNIIDDDSDWEDEEDEGAESKHDTPHRHDKRTTPVNTPTPGLFQSRSTASGPALGNIFELENKPNPNSSTWARKPEQKPPTIVFGASQGANLFGDWETSQSASGKPFQFNGTKSPLAESRIFAQSSGWQDSGELGAQTSPVIASADKGKGKASVPPAEEIGGVTIGESNTLGIDAFTNANNGHSQAALEIQPEQPRNALREVIEPGEYGGTWSWPYPYESSEQDEHYQDEYLSDGYDSNDPLLPQETEVGAEPAAPNNNDLVPVAPALAPVRPAGARGGGWLDWLLGDIPQVDRNAGNNHNDVPAAPAPDDPGDADMEDDFLDAEWNGAVNPQRPGGAQNNPENGADGAPAPVDIDEGDDFDGIMELIGMRGPILGLLQNAAISLVLITAAVMLGVAVPYIWGRILLTVLAHPLLFTVIIPWSLAVFCANLMIDTAIGVTFYALFVIDTGLRSILSTWWSKIVDFDRGEAVGTLMHTYAADAWKRVVQKLTTLALVLASDRTSMEGVSIIATHPETSHAWLASRQPWARATLAMSWFTEKLAASANLTSNASHNLQIAAQGNKTASEVFYTVFEHLVEIWKEPSIKQRNAIFIIPTVSEAEEALVEFSNSSAWTAADRVVAVIAGYVLFTIVGAWYLAKHKSQPGSYRRHLEKTSIELLQQAGGVMKVILIIGVEMFVFPLYCGLLLGTFNPRPPVLPHANTTIRCCTSAPL